MSAAVYYNEFDPFAAEWLRALMRKGLIPDGEIDTRSIVDVRPDDLRGFRQCHFFSGVAGWSHALRLAGWPDDRPIWTGSCPCQPFSVAGKGRGTDDDRHLWPVFFGLIRACRPPVVMGEQVAGAAGYRWFDGVAADLEGEDYACRAVDIPACAVNAPHIRQRLYWIAVEHAARVGWGEGRPKHEVWSGRSAFASAGGSDGHMEHPDGSGQREYRRSVAIPKEQSGAKRASGDAFDMADANGRDTIAERIQRGEQHGFQPKGGCDRRGTGDGQWASFWSDAVWLTGADGKARRAQPGVRLLAHGVPNRVGRLRGYGNAIVPPLAAEVIGAMMESLP